ncbi:quinol monooxygenase YgiN [Streptacidiphilus sp. MAP12-16]|uniref:putative quinol monooxygenase n=1 Tax=Streptacidiphilus sp. MAP12-16 TaxID=3156300 RepID=UPI00351432D1
MEALLRDALEPSRAEEGTVIWFAFKQSPTVFGVLHTFEDEQGRQAHIDGRIADALKQVGPTMFATAPEVRTTDIPTVSSRPPEREGPAPGPRPGGTGRGRRFHRQLRVDDPRSSTYG